MMERFLELSKRPAQSLIEEATDRYIGDVRSIPYAEEVYRSVDGGIVNFLTVVSRSIMDIDEWRDVYDAERRLHCDIVDDRIGFRFRAVGSRDLTKEQIKNGMTRWSPAPWELIYQRPPTV